MPVYCGLDYYKMAIEAEKWDFFGKEEIIGKRDQDWKEMAEERASRLLLANKPNHCGQQRSSVIDTTNVVNKDLPSVSVKLTNLSNNMSFIFKEAPNSITTVGPTVADAVKDKEALTQDMSNTLIPRSVSTECEDGIESKSIPIMKPVIKSEPFEEGDLFAKDNDIDLDIVPKAALDLYKSMPSKWSKNSLDCQRFLAGVTVKEEPNVEPSKHKRSKPMEPLMEEWEQKAVSHSIRETPISDLESKYFRSQSHFTRTPKPLFTPNVVSQTDSLHSSLDWVVMSGRQKENKVKEGLFRMFSDSKK